DIVHPAVGENGKLDEPVDAARTADIQALVDEGGEILVRGENVAAGYWKDGLQPLTSDGWLRTGDLGEMDEAGNIYFRGRKKDVIVTAAGLNIHPEDIEAALDRQPEVRTSAVVGVEGAHGPEPLAILIMRDDGADPARAVAAANQSLARHQQIRRWRLWPESDFPRTPTHKIRKREIIEGMRDEGGGMKEDRSGATAHVDSGGSASSLIPHPSSLQELDSLGRVELLSALEDRYQIEIDEASFTAATTVEEVEKIIQRGGGGEAAPAVRYPYPGWAQRFPVTWLRLALLYLVVLPITSVLCSVRVRGRENLSALAGGPALFVSNHITFVDHALILSALPGRFRRKFAVAQEGERLRRWRRSPAGTKWWTRLRRLAQYYLVVTFFNTFPLPQKSGFRRSFAYAGESMDRGYSVLVFPEGTRTEDGRLNPFMGGTGLLASRLNVPVVPVRIDGLFELRQEGRKFFAPPGRVSVSFGEPVRFAADEEPARITKELERRVASLRM
ncbi:MAG: 1-acyl-sn-glycerol-3-phosphate acyltransferase, partial [Pyrinomonadaceae bacterium]